MNDKQQVTNYCPMCIGYLAEVKQADEQRMIAVANLIAADNELTRLRDGLKNMSLTALDNMEGADAEGFEAWESVHVACEKLLDHLPDAGKKDGAECKDFRCPKCGSPYFGRDVVEGEDGKPMVLETVRCHGDSSGPKIYGRCDWRGVWPPEAKDGGERAMISDADAYKPMGPRFFDKTSGAHFILADESEPRLSIRGWLFYQHPDGRWVSVRKATEADLDAIYKCACGHPRSQHPRDRGCETQSCKCSRFCVTHTKTETAMQCSACNVPFEDHLGVQKTCEKLQQAEGVLRELYEKLCPIYSGTSRFCKRCHTGGGPSRPWRHAASCEMKRVEEYLAGLL